jgi:aminopeptidase
MADANIVKLADVLVNYSASVKKGQLVRISGPTLALPLLVEVYRAALAVGAHPFVRIAPEELSEIMLKNGSDEQLCFLNPVAQFEIEKIDCSIGAWAESNTRAMSNCDPKRMGLSGAARKPIMDIFLKRAAEGSLRWTGTQFPTQASAQDAEMSLSEYEQFVYGAGLLFEPDPAAAWRRIS